jgi:hypothetical protein
METRLKSAENGLRAGKSNDLRNYNVYVCQLSEDHDIRM